VQAVGFGWKDATGGISRYPEIFPGWWFGTFGSFLHSVGNFIIPTDELHHFSEG